MLNKYYIKSLKNIIVSLKVYYLVYLFVCSVDIKLRLSSYL